jgi:hypothetical protein
MRTRIVGTLVHATRVAARVAALPLAAVVVPAVAHAQGAQRELFEWRGTVDQEVRIQMRGGQTAVMGMGPREMTGYDQVRAMSGVPATDGYVRVQLMRGRGRADVVQQPRAENGYTTIVRVRDTQGGAGSYDVAAFWQPSGNYGYGNTGRYGTYGRRYPAGGSVRQPVYGNGYPADQRYPVDQGGKQIPGAQQANVPVYGGMSYPAGQRVTPNGKVLPGAAQQAYSHRYHERHRDRDRDRDRDDD